MSKPPLHIPTLEAVLNELFSIGIQNLVEAKYKLREMLDQEMTRDPNELLEAERTRFEEACREMPWFKDFQRYSPDDLHAPGEYGHYESAKGWCIWHKARGLPLKPPKA